ncbi:MAG TPA: DUF3010 family protein [Myxococcota bacterium]|nr:DUF3010 family protein [Myxococcota bacterium]
MIKLCGIELKSSAAILAVIKALDGNIELVDVDPCKISIGDDKSCTNIRSFFSSFVNFVRDNHINVVVIKSRAKRGPRAGGAVSFKLESLIQLNGVVDVEFVSGQGIAAANKSEPFDNPNNFKRYQEAAFMAACLYARRNDL